MKSPTKKKSKQHKTANRTRRAKTVVAISSRTKAPKFRQGYTVKDIQFLEEMIGECFQWTVGGVERLIDSGDTVVLKPNMAIETATPEMCMGTDPRVMEALIRVIRKSVENVRIVVGENSAGPKGITRKAFQNSGIGEAATRAGVDSIICFDEAPRIVMRIPNAKYFYEFAIPKIVLDADVYITVPKLKGHGIAQATISIKNAFGLLDYPTMFRQCHREDVYQKAVDINLARKPDFALVDALHINPHDHMSAYKSLLISFNSVIGGPDPVAVDSVCEYLMGWDNPAKQVRITRLAQAANLGIADLDAIEIKGSDPQTIRRNLLTPFDEASQTGHSMIPYEYAPLEAIFDGVEVFLGGCDIGTKAIIRIWLDSLNAQGKLPELVRKYGQVNIIAGHNVQINPAWCPLPGIVYILGDGAKEWVEIAKGWGAPVRFFPGNYPDPIAFLGDALRTLGEAFLD